MKDIYFNFSLINNTLINTITYATYFPNIFPRREATYTHSFRPYLSFDMTNSSLSAQRASEHLLLLSLYSVCVFTSTKG